MSYIELWEHILPHGRDLNEEIIKFIDEEEFLVRLPEILEPNDYKYSTALILRFGLGGNEKKTYNSVGKELNISAQVASEWVRRGLLRLRHPSRLLRLRCNLTELEKKILHDYDNPWHALISEAALRILPTRDKEESKLFVISATQIKYGKVLDPRDDYNISKYRYNIELMNELRRHFGLELLKRPEKKLTIKQIDSMVDTLKSLGYKVIAPEK